MQVGPKFLSLLLAAGMSFAAALCPAGHMLYAQQTGTPSAPQTQKSERRAAAASIDAAISPDDEVVTVETNLVAIPFSATDKNRRYVTTLKQEDIRVFENDAPQEISVFQQETELPLSLSLLIDTSGSQEETLPDEKAAAHGFVDAIIRPGRDTAAVISFTGDATVEQDLTGDRAVLHQAISRVQLAPSMSYREATEYLEAAAAKGLDPEEAHRSLPGSTAIWDAIWATANEIMSQTPERTRRAIILLSDGKEDSSSPLKKDDAIEAALKANTVIYSIGIGGYEIDKGALKKISERTGGRAFFPESEAELNAAFAQIQQELRSQYLIAYSPQNKERDNSYRQLKIEIVNPELRKEKLKLSYRQGYFARAAAPVRIEQTPNRKLSKPPRRAKKK